MISILYLICLILSAGNVLYLAQKKNVYVDKYYWSMVIIIPIINLGYWIRNTAKTPEAAVVAVCFIYLDGTVLLAMILFSAMKSINIPAPTGLKLVVYGITTVHLFSIWLCRGTNLYYSSVSLVETKYGTATRMTSGPLKITHYIYVGAMLLALVAVLAYAFIKKAAFSKRTLISYAFMAIFAIIVYAVEILIKADFTMLPVVYAIGSYMIAFSFDHIQSHDIFNLIGVKQAKTGLRGFCALDMNRCLLGTNRQFGEMIPEINSIAIDAHLQGDSATVALLNDAIDTFIEREQYLENIEIGDRVLNLMITYFSINEDKPDGYLLEISDVTENHRQMELINRYNERLTREVEEKTEHILEIQNSVVLGLANMVENRDDNTGGHVKRTSDVIRILTAEIRRQGAYRIDATKANAIVRAAAMHDLGKISVDKAILCKPGKLDADEYANMQTHATKSGEIVRIILEGVEEDSFVHIAYNIARYHHERWDGKGYPEGLIGESIPVEARIMAVADVYDALVSERCYKQPMSFEEAAKIMNESMGTQFDPAMRPIFAACREKLEMYYRLDL